MPYQCVFILRLLSSSHPGEREVERGEGRRGEERGGEQEEKEQEKEESEEVTKTVVHLTS